MIHHPNSLVFWVQHFLSKESRELGKSPSSALCGSKIVSCSFYFVNSSCSATRLSKQNKSVSSSSIMSRCQQEFILYRFVHYSNIVIIKIFNRMQLLSLHRCIKGSNFVDSTLSARFFAHGCFLKDFKPLIEFLIFLNHFSQDTLDVSHISFPPTR